MTHQTKGVAASHSAEARFMAYLDGIIAWLGYASPVASARAYCTGLLLPVSARASSAAPVEK